MPATDFILSQKQVNCNNILSNYEEGNKMLKYITVDIKDLDDDTLRRSFSCMSDERKDRVRRIKKADQKKCTLAGEWLVRKMLSDATGDTPESFVIFADDKGKLHSNNSSGLFFNISHSKNVITAVISDKTVGIDIEKIRPVSLKLAKRVCTPNELNYVFGTDDADFDAEYPPKVTERFFEIWTIKEAYFKCIGTGITDFFAVDALNGNFSKLKIIENGCIIHIVTL